MSDKNPYETLGLAESASFEEIQAAKQQLSAQLQDDRIAVEQLEAAYDAIIMDRLRQRQQGTLAVPDQIRFAESQKKSLELPKPSLPSATLPTWLTDLRDTPEPQDVNLALGIHGAIAVGCVFLDVGLASTLLTVALIANVYLLYRKERRFGRAVVIGLVGLVAGIALGSGLNMLLLTTGVNVAIAPEQILVVTSSVIFGITASLLR